VNSREEEQKDGGRKRKRKRKRRVTWRKGGLTEEDNVVQAVATVES
jgi:hypothetical protein